MKPVLTCICCLFECLKMTVVYVFLTLNTPSLAGTSPLVQRWLTSGDLTSAEPDGLDDIMRL